MDGRLATAILDMDTEFDKLESIIPAAKRDEPWWKFNRSHYEYYRHITTSLNILFMDKSVKHNIATISLLRLLCESLAVQYERTRLNQDDLRKFMRSYRNGKPYPKSSDEFDISERQTFRAMAGRLPFGDPTEAKKLYDEASKATHFSGKTLELMTEDNLNAAYEWTVVFLDFVTKNYRKTQRTLGQSIDQTAHY